VFENVQCIEIVLCDACVLEQSCAVSLCVITCCDVCVMRVVHVFQSGHLPAVRVWDLEDNSSIAQFSGHQFGVNCVVGSQ